MMIIRNSLIRDDSGGGGSSSSSSGSGVTSGSSEEFIRSRTVNLGLKPVARERDRSGIYKTQRRP